MLWFLGLRREHPTFGGEGAVKSLEVVSSIDCLHDCRVLLLSDSLACVLSCERRRARNYKLLVVIRRLVGLAFALGLQLTFRWIPSEFNIAHGPSIVLKLVWVEFLKTIRSIQMVVMIGQGS